MKLRRLLIIVGFVFSFAFETEAQTSSYEELQAAYLFNFAKYIKWPEQTHFFVIGVYGEEPEIMEILKATLKDKKVSGKEIQIRNISDPIDVSSCHILYLPESRSKNLAAITDETLGKSVLVVTEEDMTRKGATISFVVEDDKLRFKIRRDLLQRAGLTASEGLLRLAIVL